MSRESSLCRHLPFLKLGPLKKPPPRPPCSKRVRSKHLSVSKLRFLSIKSASKGTDIYVSLLKLSPNLCVLSARWDVTPNAHFIDRPPIKGRFQSPPLFFKPSCVASGGLATYVGFSIQNSMSFSCHLLTVDTVINLFFFFNHLWNKYIGIKLMNHICIHSAKVLIGHLEISIF